MRISNRPGQHVKRQISNADIYNPAAETGIFNTIKGPNATAVLDQVSNIVAQNANIQLAFWGSAWNNPGDIDPGTLVGAVASYIGYPYTNTLSQYANASIAGITLEPLLLPDDPPQFYNDTDLQNRATQIYNDQGLFFDAFYYVIIVMPPGTQYANLLTADGGAHANASNDFQNPFGWVAYFGSFDFLTYVISHELVEMITDPYGAIGQAGTTVNHVGGPYGDVLGEIADAGWAWAGTVNGVLVAAYWSDSDKNCVVPGGFDVHKNSGCLIQSDYGTQGDFYVVVPHTGSDGGLISFVRRNDDSPPDWNVNSIFDQGRRVNGCSVIQSNFESVELMATANGILYYYDLAFGNATVVSLESPLISNPTPIENCVGTPGFIQSNVGMRGDYKVLVARKPIYGSLSLFYLTRSNDEQYLPWTGQYSTLVELILPYNDSDSISIAMIQAKISSYTNLDENSDLYGHEQATLGVSPDQYSLHFIVRTAGHLYHYYCSSLSEFYPVPELLGGGAIPMSINGATIENVIGDIGFVEFDNYFIISVVFEDGHVQLYFRVNTLPALPWANFAAPVPFYHASNCWLSTSNYASVFSKRLELLIEDSDRDYLRHYSLNDDLSWNDQGFVGQPNQ